MPFAGLSIFGDERYRRAALPLFSSGAVEAIEWTVDSWRSGPPPAESAAYLKDFGAAGRLIGHGIHYPLLSPDAEDLRLAWLAELRRDAALHRYCGVSVHFGFSTGWELAEGAPLPVPYCPAAVDTGKKALAALAAAAGCRPGIENLALAFSLRDVQEQGRFIREMLEEAGGYLLLDLHNIYCQSVNFGLPLLEIVKSYPLGLVEEIHVSGGSWSAYGDAKIRRDTHDGRVPEDLLAALPEVIALCPHIRFVLLEKLPHSFTTSADEEGFREDFLKMKAAVGRVHAKA